MSIVGTLSQPVTPAGTVGGAMPAMHSGTAQGAYLDSLTLAADANAADDFYRWMRVRITGGAGAGQERVILASRRNLLAYSDQFSNAAWAKNQSTISANVVAAPDGAMTADKLVPNNGVTGYLARTYNFVAGQIVSYAIDAKAAELSAFNTLLTQVPYGGTGGNRFVTFDLAAVTAVATGTGVSGSIAALEAGWYRCTTTFVPTTSATVGTQLVRPTANGDGTSGLYIWGGQQVLGADPGFTIQAQSAAAVGIQIDRPWLALPDATSTYELYLPGATAVGVLAQP